MTASNQNNDIQRVLGRMEGTLTAVHGLLANLHKDHDKLENRIGSVEQKLYYGLGAAAVVSPVILLLLKVGLDKVFP